MSTPTRSSANSLSQDSRLLMGNLPGARFSLTAVGTAAALTVNAATLLAELGAQTALYTGSTPGLVIVLSCAADPTKQGSTANITGVNTGTGVLTTSSNANFTTLAAGDVIGVAPPLSVNLFLPSGHTLDSSLANDYTQGINETFDTHNTAMGVTVGGDVPLFQILTSEGFGRMMAFGVGGYKNSGSTHTYRPFKADDGTFTRTDDATFYAQDGNGVVRRVFFGNFSTSLKLDWPGNARAMASFTTLGNGSMREIGGSLRTIPVGATSWDRTGLACDTGPGITFRSAFAELGGAFGDAMTSNVDTSMQELHLTINRGSIVDNTLGDPYIVKPLEMTHQVTVTGTGILQTDQIKELADGGANDAEPGSGFKGETRLLLKAISPNDLAKTVTIDIPRGVFSTDAIDRPKGRFKQNFEYHGLATTASGCIDTAKPLYQITLANGQSKNYATAL